jgi:hypothetical protein
MNEWVLDPLSIATHGYVGHGPTFGDYCPIALAIASHGYIRFDVQPPDDPFDGGAGHGAVISVTSDQRAKQLTEDMQLALFAVMAIDETEH